MGVLGSQLEKVAGTQKFIARQVLAISIATEPTPELSAMNLKKKGGRKYFRQIRRTLWSGR